MCASSCTHCTCKWSRSSSIVICAAGDPEGEEEGKAEEEVEVEVEAEAPKVNAPDAREGVDGEEERVREGREVTVNGDGAVVVVVVV